jgi:hypothetical protein
LIAVLHSHDHDDGGRPILERLAEKYELLSEPDKTVYRLMAAKRNRDRRPLVVEGEYPMHLSELVERHQISIDDVTAVLLIVDAGTLQFDPNGVALRMIANANRATGVALGNLHKFDPESELTRVSTHLPEKSKRLFSFVQRVIGIPVVYAMTGETVIDRESEALAERRSMNAAKRLNRTVTNNKPPRDRRGVIRQTVNA